MITVEKYGRRHFAVYLNGGLLAVTLYKRGAVEVQKTLETLRRHFGYLPLIKPNGGRS